MFQSIHRDLLIAWTLLSCLTPARRRLLVEHFDTAAGNAAFIARLLGIPIEDAAVVADPLRDSARRELVSSLRDDCLTPGDEDYPPLLRHISDPPLALFIAGRREVLGLRNIAVVGSRRASPYALNATRFLARELAAGGITVVSGMARGVDTAAHEAALDAGGTTVAILGNGIDVVYPRENRRLRDRILEGGVVVSEHAPGTPPKPEHFPARNRIIAGMTGGTIVVEASARSGSLITARLAAEEGREVFAVPGSIFSAGSEGTHRLIQYGAKLVHDVRDVFEELEPPPAAPAAAHPLLSLLSWEEGIHVDTLAARGNFSPTDLASALLELELSGAIRALPGGRYVRLR